MSDKTATVQSTKDQLTDKLRQVKEANDADGRLEGLQKSLSEEHEAGIRSGRFDDEASVGNVTVIRTKLDMIPHRRRQIRELRDGVFDDIAPLIQDLRRENGERLNKLSAVLREGFDLAARESVKRIVPGLEEAAANHIIDSLWAYSCPGRTLARMDPTADQIWDPRFERGTVLTDQSRSVLALSDKLTRLESRFLTKDGKFDPSKLAVTPATESFDQ